MTLNGVMALILRYFTEFVYGVVRNFTFAISSPDEFLVLLAAVDRVINNTKLPIIKFL